MSVGNKTFPPKLYKHDVCICTGTSFACQTVIRQQLCGYVSASAPNMKLILLIALFCRANLSSLPCDCGHLYPRNIELVKMKVKGVGGLIINRIGLYSVCPCSKNEYMHLGETEEHLKYI